MTTRRCEACGGQLAAETKRARFCSAGCRSRAHRERRAAREQQPAPPSRSDHPPPAVDELARAVEEMFTHPDLAGFDVNVQKAAARALVSIAASGGAPAVSAIRELRRLMADLEEILR